MKSLPFVSIIVTSYNRSDILVDSLSSLVNLDYDKDFYEIQLDFLINHQFHTEFMRKNGKKLKEKNLLDRL